MNDFKVLGASFQKFCILRENLVVPLIRSVQFKGSFPLWKFLDFGACSFGDTVQPNVHDCVCDSGISPTLRCVNYIRWGDSAYSTQSFLFTGSCWAVSAAETMSDRLCIHSNSTIKVGREFFSQCYVLEHNAFTKFKHTEESNSWKHLEFSTGPKTAFVFV